MKQRWIMVKITYDPWKEIIIHEVFQYDLPELVNLQGLGVPSGQLGSPIYWSNGVAYVHLNMPNTEEVLKEYLQGRIHWRNLFFAFMPKYQNVILIPEGNVRIPIINVSKNEKYSDVAEWLKQNFKPA